MNRVQARAPAASSTKGVPSAHEKTTSLARRAAVPGGPREELFARISARVYGYFCLRTWRRRDAEDLAEETLLAALVSFPRQDPGCSFNAWLFRKAHEVFDAWELERAETAGDRPRRPEPVPPAESGQPSEDDAESLLGRLSRRVPSEVYDAFLLYYRGELSEEEVAERFGVVASTVRRWIGEAEDQLEGLLEGDRKADAQRA